MRSPKGILHFTALSPKEKGHPWNSFTTNPCFAKKTAYTSAAAADSSIQRTTRPAFRSRRTHQRRRASLLSPCNRWAELLPQRRRVECMLAIDESVTVTEGDSDGAEDAHFDLDSAVNQPLP